MAIEIESYYAELSKNASQVQPKETRSRNEHHNYSESVLDQSPAVHHCGATLITDRFLLSAAHCFAGISFNNQPQQFANLRIGVGATRVNEMQKHQIARVHLHPKSNRSAHYNDIALIELRFPVKFNDLVRPICLPFVGHSSYDAKPAANSTHSDRGPLLARLSTNRRRVVTERAEQQDRPIESEAIENLAELTSLLLTTEGAQANIAGLGDTQFGGKRADVLQQARLVLINRQRCDAAYRRLNSSQLNDGINEQFLCASDRNVAARFLTNPRHIWRRRRQVDGESTGRMAADQEMADACQGDSGGPLITRLDSNTIKRNAFIASNLSASEISANQLQQLQQRLMKDQEQLIPHDLEGRIYLIGIVSLGRQCSDQEFPGVYVNVNYYKDWILSKLYGRL